MFSFTFKSLISLTILLSLFSRVISAEVEDLRIGVTHKIPEEKCPRKSAPGDIIKMHYSGELMDGTVFDSSYKRGQPLEFTLGAGQVIKGWDQGLQKMCIGEKRKLTIPSHLAYGKRGAGNVIPPDATLVFHTELVGIEGYELPEEIDRDEL